MCDGKRPQLRVSAVGVELSALHGTEQYKYFFASFLLIVLYR